MINLKACTWMFTLMLLGTAAQAASTLRCANNVVSLNDRTVEVERKCGAPASKAQAGYQRTGPIDRREELPVEEWVYGPANGMYQYLKFVGNKLVEIESGRH